MNDREQVTSESRGHKAEADKVRKWLKDEYGVDAEMVAPTRDGRGHVRLNFRQLRLVAGRGETDTLQQ